MKPDSCDGMDRCLIENHIAVVYPATSEHPSNYEGRQTDKRLGRLQPSQAGLYLKR